MKLASLIAVGATVMVGSPALAAPAPPSVSEVKAIFARTNSTGVLSDADRSKLLLLPEASIIMDPNSGVVVEEPTNAKAAGDVQPSAVVAAAAGCQAKDRYIVYKSLTRSKTVDYHFTVNWCYNSSQAITSNTRGHYIVAYTPGMYDRGFTNNNFAYTRANKYSAQVDLQSEVEQCILKYGCLFSAHPRSRWGIYGNGDYTYTGYQ